MVEHKFCKLGVMGSNPIEGSPGKFKTLGERIKKGKGLLVDRMAKELDPGSIDYFTGGDKLSRVRLGEDKNASIVMADLKKAGKNLELKPSSGKKPWVAAIFSLLFFGLGYAYAGNTKKFLAYFGLVLSIEVLITAVYLNGLAPDYLLSIVAYARFLALYPMLYLLVIVDSYGLTKTGKSFMPLFNKASPPKQ